MAEIGIVIVTYNSGGHIGACLDAAIPRADRIVVVDNASADHTREEVAARGVDLITNPTNRGFAAAVNQGFRALNTPYVLLLNPDAILETSLEPLRECCDLPFIAGAGGKLIDAAGRPQTGFVFRRFPTPAALSLEALTINRLWPGNPVNWRFRCLGNDLEKAQPVEQPAGAFLMVRHDVWEKIGCFDEEYHPLWFEDVDFARRAALAGYGMYYTPRVVAKHTGGHSISNMPLEIRVQNWYRSFLRYVARHFGPWSGRGVCLAIVAGCFIRMVFEVFARRSLEPISVYCRVARLAGRYLLFGSSIKY
jgi:GT2 family glycosyltransferase